MNLQTYRRLQSLSVHFLQAVLLLTLAACAQQVPPEGGPSDTIPPRIVGTYPANYTTRYQEKKVVLEFDKYVDERSAEESIFISPYVGALEFDWSGKEVTMIFSGNLRRNTTYVVNVGTDVRDLRPNPNRMAQSFTLAFSTGDDIDHGAIEGRVFVVKPDDPVEGVMIFAYQLKGMNPDTLNPRSRRPDYITQTGKNGAFSLKFLEFGDYRVLAVRDEFRNLLYDPEADDFAVPADSISLTPTDTMKSGLFLQLAREDTTMPRIIKASWRDRFHLTAEFSESVDTAVAFSPSFAIMDTLTKENVKVVGSFPDLPKTSSFTIIAGPQDSTRSYRVRVLRCRDLAGNPVNPLAHEVNTSPSSKVDTSGVHVSFPTLRDSALNVDLKGVVRLQFSDAPMRLSAVSALRYEDSSRVAVPFSVRWISATLLTAEPVRSLSGNSWYRLSIDMRSVQDWSGRGSRDSIRSVRFRTVEEEVFGSIEGVVMDQKKNDREGDLFVLANSVGKKDAIGYTAKAASNGAFVLPSVVEGMYILRAYRDRNGNGMHDPGRPFPFSYSERFSVYPDTLRVRARWPLEGVRLELR